jgi:hypothetical protein
MPLVEWEPLHRERVGPWDPDEPRDARVGEELVSIWGRVTTAVRD